MAKQVTKGLLAKRLGDKARKAFNAHKNDATVYDSGGQLPPFENGVAQLTKCYIGEYDNGELKGQLFFRAEGTIIRPKKATDGTPIEGRTTSIMEPLCDTPKRTSRKTFDEHLAWVLNELRKLGADTSGLDFDDLEDVMEALVEEAPYFNCRAWRGTPTKEYPDPRTNEVWNGIKGLEDFDPETDDDVVDETGEDEEPVEEATEEATEEAGDELDLDALGAAADADPEGEEARQLYTLATDNGIDPDEIETWAEVVELIKAAQEGGDEEATEEEAEEEEVTPSKTDVYAYKPKGKTKPVECEVILVNAKNKTVSLKNMDDGKTVYKNVPWSALIQP